MWLTEFRFKDLNGSLRLFLYAGRIVCPRVMLSESHNRLAVPFGNEP